MMTMTNAPAGANAFALPVALASTFIPALGMTFAEADAKARELIQAHPAIEGEDAESDARRNELANEWHRINVTLFTTQPRTPADAVAVLNRLLCPDTGIPIGTNGMEEGTLTLVRGFLATLVEKGLHGVQAPGAAISNPDATTTTPDKAASSQPPYPPKVAYPPKLVEGAPIVWREQPGAQSVGSLYTVMDCAIVGPFFLDVILQDEPETPEAPFLWSLCRLLGDEFIIRGDESTLAAAKAAAEEAAREAMAVEPSEPIPSDPEARAPATIAAAIEEYNDGRWGATHKAWMEFDNDDRLEANIAVLSERFRLALAAAAPPTNVDDALALVGLLHEVVEDAHNPNGWPLYGARATMVAVIAEALVGLARRGLQPAGIIAGMPSLPPAASK